MDRPVNVLALPACPPVAELAAAGVSRIRLAGSYARVAYGALADAATELRDRGTYHTYLGPPGEDAVRALFSDRGLVPGRA